MFVMVSAAASAWAQAPGTTDEIWISGSASSASNVSITGANGDLWFAIEHVDPSTPNEPALTVLWFDTSVPSMNTKLLQNTGGLIGNAIYPSILTWPSANNVLVTGKVDEALYEPHLRIYAQDRDDFTATLGTETVTVSGTLEHAVPHLTRDKVLPEQHLCWTDKDTSGTTEHVTTKAKDASTWLSSTLRTVSNTSDTEDHCQIDFTYSGRRYTVYHRDTSGADPDIWLEITTWDGSTWTEIADFGLTDSDGLDFPSLWLHNTATTVEVGVVAANNGNIAFWHCGPTTESSCDSAAELGSPQVTTTGGNRNFPQVFIVPRSTTTDTFVLVENPASTTVKILSLCGGSGTSFTDEGALPLPTGYSATADEHLGFAQSWARSQVKWDGTEFHVSFLAEKPSVTTLNVLRYHAEPGDLCP